MDQPHTHIITCDSWVGWERFLSYTRVYRKTYRTDTLKLNAVEQNLIFGLFEYQEDAEEFAEPNQVVYTEKDLVSTIGYDSENNNDSKESRKAGYRGTTLEINGFNQHERQHQGAQQNELSFMSQGRNVYDSQRMLAKNIEVATKKVQEIKDQLILAKAYLKIAPPSSNLRLRDLERLTREMELAVGEVTQDSDLSMR
ncbi:unnamed protein product [Sphenostylis stenocarpa]|uniref:Uncharacterized protein n=1 Tax=Sphenostylis stenocarpa TaxID=92480 RepID=A0AA86T6E3_9FABA|nr:unnamed protein product [Sphenostylis stenocarpa]